MRRTYRYRLYPTRRQVAALEDQLGQACDLYNAALEHRRRMWKEHGTSVSFAEQCRELRELRASELMDPGVNHWSQSAVLRRLERAFEAFFRRLKAGEKPGYPRFQSRHRFDTLHWSFRGHGGVGFADGRLRLQGIGHIKVRQHRPLPEEATLRQVAVKRSCGRWYACFSLDDVAPRPLSATGQVVGVDLGISTFAALSTGELISGPRANRAASFEVRRAQRKVARRKRGSNRRCKAVALLARQREREANRRRDHAHKTARALVQRFDTIYLEDLNIRGLAQGMLARDCTDQGWSAFVARLTEKAEEAARQVVLVDARYTSQACSACGVIVPKDLAVRVHSCACGYTADRDVNAARNVLTRGLGRSLHAITVGAEVHAVA